MSTYECTRCGAGFGIAGGYSSEDDYEADDYFDEQVAHHESGACTLARDYNDGMTTYTVTIAPTTDTLSPAEDMILTAYAKALAGCRSLRLDADADLRRDLDVVAAALGHSAAAQLETERAE